jgi:hypothetical protein
MGLDINEEKTKCMVITYMEARRNKLDKNLIICDHHFEVVEKFKYLGTLINTKNNVSEEIKKGITAANVSYRGLHKILKSKYITWHSKTRLYKTLIRPVIAYGPEAWVLNRCDESMINVFERKILRKIFGAVREGDHWRAWCNNELYGLYREQDLVSYIKVGRMRWAGREQNGGLRSS